MPKRKRRPNGAYAGRAFGRRRPQRGAQQLQRGKALTAEVKFADFQAVNDAFATSWATMEDATIKCISAVALGNTESTRIGRKMSIVGLNIRGTVNAAVLEAQVNPMAESYCRIVIVCDKQTNAADITPANVYDEGQTENWLAFRNLQFSTRFRILMDKTIVIKPNLVAQGAIDLFATNLTKIPWNFNLTLKRPINVLYKADDAEIASITDNSIHVIGVCSSTGPTPSLSYQARLRFTG